ncbi:MAG: anti-sigma factor family protein [Gemmatimonadota bacterium]
MSQRVTHEELMRYLDGEMAPEDRNRIERSVEESTELRREIAVFQSMKDDLQTLKLTSGGRGHSVWDSVNRQLTRPIGWTLLVVGSLVWAVYGIYVYLTSPVFLLEKMAASAIGIGVLLLFASVVWERYREWLSDPYRDLQR